MKKIIRVSFIVILILFISSCGQISTTNESDRENAVNFDTEEDIWGLIDDVEITNINFLDNALWNGYIPNQSTVFEPRELGYGSSISGKQTEISLQYTGNYPVSMIAVWLYSDIPIRTSSSEGDYRDSFYLYVYASQFCTDDCAGIAEDTSIFTGDAEFLHYNFHLDKIMVVLEAPIGSNNVKMIEYKYNSNSNQFQSYVLYDEAFKAIE